MKPTDRIFVAIDTPDLEGAVALARDLDGLVGGVKVGKEFFTANGPEGVRRIGAEGMPVFLDLKFHDIPDAAFRTVMATGPLVPSVLTVHASGGAAMIRAACDAANTLTHRPMIFAVTLLRSMNQESLRTIGVHNSLEEYAIKLANLACKSGVDGVVCGPHEAMRMRGACGSEIKLCVVGIKPSWSEYEETMPTATPQEAISLGADYIVVGRAVTGSKDPRNSVTKIVNEIEKA